MVGEVVVPKTSRGKDLQGLTALHVPLMQKGNFQQGPHLLPGAKTFRAAWTFLKFAPNINGPRMLRWLEALYREPVFAARQP